MQFTLMDGMIFGGAFALVLLIVIAVAGGASQRQMKKRIARIKHRKDGEAKHVQDMSLRRKKQEVQGIFKLLLRPLPDFRSLETRLERAGKTLSPKQFILRCLLYALIVAFITAGLLKKPLLLGIFLGVIVGFWIPFKLLDRSIARQSKRFISLFPDAIDLIVRGLRSGLPVSESVKLVAQEVPEPVGGVFRNLADTMKLGVTLEKSLQDTAKKLDLTEFNFFTTSIVLQRETGGNLSEILNNLSEVLRSRYLMRMKIKAMSSEARASAYIIGALPFVVILAVSIFSPGYMNILFTDYRGNICAAVAACMMIFGMWVMNRMTRFEL